MTVQYYHWFAMHGFGVVGFLLPRVTGSLIGS